MSLSREEKDKMYLKGILEVTGKRKNFIRLKIYDDNIKIITSCWIPIYVYGDIVKSKAYRYFTCNWWRRIHIDDLIKMLPHNGSAGKTRKFLRESWSKNIIEKGGLT
jgi:hypothetical protein